MSTMTNVTKLQQKQALKVHCSACGAQADAACDCGVGYLSASEFAAKAAAEHPEMSNRAIAEMTGVSPATVDRVRKSGASNEAPQTRTGLDGKQHPTERKPSSRQEADDDPTRETPQKLRGEATKFVRGFDKRVREWLKTKPLIPERDKHSLGSALGACSEMFDDLANRVANGKESSRSNNFAKENAKLIVENERLRAEIKRMEDRLVAAGQLERFTMVREDVAMAEIRGKLIFDNPDKDPKGAKH